jgi:hypothetical protein
MRLSRRSDIATTPATACRSWTSALMEAPCQSTVDHTSPQNGTIFCHSPIPKTDPIANPFAKNIRSARQRKLHVGYYRECAIARFAVC